VIHRFTQALGKFRGIKRSVKKRRYYLHKVWDTDTVGACTHKEGAKGPGRKHNGERNVEFSHAQPTR
jgi:hypothetical protein